MKCEYCGKVLNKNHKFCPECGAKVGEVETEVQEEVKTPVEENETHENAEQDTKPKRSGMGIAGFILGLCGLCFRSFVPSLLGVIFGSIAMNATKDTKQNRGLIIAGFVLGLIGLVLSVIEFIVNVSTANWEFWRVLVSL